MNPGKLNKRITFSSPISFTVWGQKIVKTKRQNSEQNEEQYEFIIRKIPLQDYSVFTCEGTQYIIITADDWKPGYLTLKCEKAKIHTFYDSLVVKRYTEIETEYGSTTHEWQTIYTDIPCEMVRIQSSSTSQSEQQNEVFQEYEVFVENSVSLKIGDLLEITHKGDSYKANVTKYFKTHTHQVISIKLESEA